MQFLLDTNQLNQSTSKVVDNSNDIERLSSIMKKVGYDVTEERDNLNRDISTMQDTKAYSADLNLQTSMSMQMIDGQTQFVTGSVMRDGVEIFRVDGASPEEVQVQLEKFVEQKKVEFQVNFENQIAGLTNQKADFDKTVDSVSRVNDELNQVKKQADVYDDAVKQVIQKVKEAEDSSTQSINRVQSGKDFVSEREYKTGDITWQRRGEMPYSEEENGWGYSVPYPGVEMPHFDEPFCEYHEYAEVTDGWGDKYGVGCNGTNRDIYRGMIEDMMKRLAGKMPEGGEVFFPFCGLPLRAKARELMEKDSKLKSYYKKLCKAYSAATEMASRCMWYENQLTNLGIPLSDLPDMTALLSSFKCLTDANGVKNLAKPSSDAKKALDNAYEEVMKRYDVSRDNIAGRPWLKQEGKRTEPKEELTKVQKEINSKYKSIKDDLLKECVGEKPEKPEKYTEKRPQKDDTLSKPVKPQKSGVLKQLEKKMEKIENGTYTGRDADAVREKYEKNLAAYNEKMEKYETKLAAYEEKVNDYNEKLQTYEDAKKQYQADLKAYKENSKVYAAASEKAESVLNGQLDKIERANNILSKCGIHDMPDVTDALKTYMNGCEFTEFGEMTVYRNGSSSLNAIKDAYVQFMTDKGFTYEQQCNVLAASGLENYIRLDDPIRVGESILIHELVGIDPATGLEIRSN